MEESCKVKPIVTVFFSFSLYGETFCPFEVRNLVWNFLEQKLPKLGSCVSDSKDTRSNLNIRI